MNTLSYQDELQAADDMMRLEAIATLRSLRNGEIEKAVKQYQKETSTTIQLLREVIRVYQEYIEALRRYQKELEEKKGGEGV